MSLLEEMFTEKTKQLYTECSELLITDKHSAMDALTVCSFVLGIILGNIDLSMNIDAKEISDRLIATSRKATIEKFNRETKAC